jgi:nicotinamide mononucleotide transporter PnuC
MMQTIQSSEKSTFWASLSLFQKIFLVVFLLANILSFFSPLVMGAQFSALFTTLSFVGLLCSISGVFTALYQARGEIIAYAFVIVNTTTYAWISWKSNLYGQVFQNMILLLPIQIAGLLAWHRNMANSKDNKITIKTFKPSHWVFTVIGGLIFWYVYRLFLINFPDIMHAFFGVTMAADPSPTLDSLTTVLTVMAMLLTAKRFIEQWYFWLLCNVGVVLFIENLIHTTAFTPSVLVGDLSGMFMWLQYGVGAIYGFYLWKKMHRERNRIDLELD